jgi:phage shock protein E
MKAILVLLAVFFGIIRALPVKAATEGPTIIDVRTAEEFAESHLKGAINIDVLQPDFKNRISRLDKTKIFKVYCRSGGRAGKASELMNSAGFKNVENLGGLNQASKKLNLQCDGKGSC